MRFSMGRTIGRVLVFLLLVAGFTAPLKPPSPIDALQGQINEIYRKSVAECAAYYGGDPGCIKAQFQRNYRWEIIRDQKGPVGPPGVPGPMSGDEPRTTAPDRTQCPRQMH
jgi:hypothetical protein